MKKAIKLFSAALSKVFNDFVPISHQVHQTFFTLAVLCAVAMMAGCGTPYDGEVLIHPREDVQTDTLLTATDPLDISCAEVTLKGYTKDTLFLSFSDGCFWRVKLIGRIDTTYRDDWYDAYLPVSYHTKTTNDSDSIVIKYWM